MNIWISSVGQYKTFTNLFTSYSQSPDENQNETKISSSKEEKETPKLRKGEVLEDSKAEEKLSIVQKFKLMYKQYWYVLIPVHIATSVVWYGSFFIAAKR